MDYRDNRQRWAESHQVVHFYAGQWCTFTPALTVAFFWFWLFGSVALGIMMFFTRGEKVILTRDEGR